MKLRIPASCGRTTTPHDGLSHLDAYIPSKHNHNLDSTIQSFSLASRTHMSPNMLGDCLRVVFSLLLMLLLGSRVPRIPRQFMWLDRMVYKTQLFSWIGPSASYILRVHIQSPIEPSLIVRTSIAILHQVMTDIVTEATHRHCGILQPTTNGRHAMSWIYHRGTQNSKYKTSCFWYC